MPATLLAQTPSPPVVASAGSVIEGGGTYLTFTITNNSSVAVTAWGVKAAYVLPDGQVSRQRYGRDGYLAFAGVLPDLDRTVVPPHSGMGEKIRISPSNGLGGAIRVDMEVDFAIFADGTSFGSEQETADMFARRSADLRVWLRIQKAIESARKTASGRSAVVMIQTELASGDEGTFADRHLKTTRANLAAILAKARDDQASDAEVNASLGSLLEQATARARAAADHSTRR
jgi:hypothetical protein